ncbi:glutathione S-transferase family protein [Kineobactrum sediminis]|uniref:Glutathione S-transferase family protein n=1 Tax=Kineobactrum sediminis TaxID=1905677 RepID=A0A2N5XYQ6_9GAMM|nr:glutathione S-transferase family protein [Kineobactrum sediminis]PLW81278.1 glutathione S-transferase family protein [Kineobactrum sediminis]
MITLHGFPFSNYHNIVKHALLAKGLEFEENIVYPASEALLAVNPLGKVPAMTTAEGTPLSETSVLLEYLEEKYPETALYPADLEARAKTRQLMKLSELYLELPARRLLPAVLGNAIIPVETLDEVRAALQRGVSGLTELAAFSPYVCGEDCTLADIYLRYALAIPKLVGPAKLDWDVVAAVPGLADWDEMMAASDIAKRIDADQAANAGEFMAYVAKQR